MSHADGNWKRWGLRREESRSRLSSPGKADCIHQTALFIITKRTPVNPSYQTTPFCPITLQTHQTALFFIILRTPVNPANLFAEVRRGFLQGLITIFGKKIKKWHLQRDSTRRALPDEEPERSDGNPPHSEQSHFLRLQKIPGKKKKPDWQIYLLKSGVAFCRD